jgi:hypothetical protein
MSQICEGLERGSFKSAPANVTSMTVDAVSGMLPSEHSVRRSEFFIRGTEPTLVDNFSGPVYICPISGYLATPYCPARVPFGSATTTSGGDEDNPEAVDNIVGPRPRHYCHLHNGDTELYPINPAETLNEDFYWDGLLRDDAYYEELAGGQETEGDPTQGDLSQWWDATQNGQGATDGTGPFPNPTPETPDQSRPQDDGDAPTDQTRPPEGSENGDETQEESTRPNWLPPLTQ